ELRGKLVHHLPGPLREVTLLHVTPFRTPLRRYQPGPLPIPVAPGEVLAYGRMYVVQSWNPGEVLDLQQAMYPRGPVFLPAPRDEGSLSLNIDSYNEATDDVFGTTAGLNASLQRRFLNVLTLFQMAQPLDWVDI